MHKKFVIAVCVIVLALGALITSATTSTAKSVVTVTELVSTKAQHKDIRLGARLTADEIDYQVEPELKLQFRVHDIISEDDTYEKKSAVAQASIPVLFEGIMPDTLKPGRDVILEGTYDGERFHATSLLTQCPSKYEPPVAPQS